MASSLPPLLIVLGAVYVVVLVLLRRRRPRPPLRLDYRLVDEDRHVSVEVCFDGRRRRCVDVLDPAAPDFEQRLAEAQVRAVELWQEGESTGGRRRGEPKARRRPHRLRLRPPLGGGPRRG